MALVLGGAIGNQIDRVRWAMSPIFSSFSAGGRPMLQWPAWNVADACIVVGVILLALLLLWLERRMTTQVE